MDYNNAAGKFGYGMSTQGPTQQATDKQFDESVNKFASAHNATQLTISGLTTTNQQLTAANQQLQQQLAIQQHQLMCVVMKSPPIWQQQFKPQQ